MYIILFSLLFCCFFFLAPLLLILNVEVPQCWMITCCSLVLENVELQSWTSMNLGKAWSALPMGNSSQFSPWRMPGTICGCFHIVRVHWACYLAPGWRAWGRLLNSLQCTGQSPQQLFTCKCYDITLINPTVRWLGDKSPAELFYILVYIGLLLLFLWQSILTRNILQTPDHLIEGKWCSGQSVIVVKQSKHICVINLKYYELWFTSNICDYYL